MGLRQFSLTLVLSLACLCRAGIFYDDQAKCIRVVDFPKEAPCTLRTLLRMARLHGWHFVVHDDATDTYRVSSDLWIGSNDGTDTYLQVGSREHPRETLIMNGDLVMHPFWIQGQNCEPSWRQASKAVNRLTVGVPGDPSVRPMLKFEPSHMLILGRVPAAEGRSVTGHGGQLHVHHAAITSASPGVAFGRPSAKAGMRLTGDSVVLDHASLSWIKGFMTYGMGHNGSVRDSVFDHGGAAIINGQHDLRRCVLSDCGTAVLDYGSLDAVLTDCTFTRNDCNWSLAFSKKGLVCIDCTYDPPKKGNVYRCWVNRRTKQKQYPSFVSKRHIIVEVVGAHGEEIAGAQVRARCEQGAAAMAVHGTQTTNKLGRTPGKDEGDAILLTELMRQATDVANQPRETVYSYTIEAGADGFAPNARHGFRPTRSWEVVRLVLARK